MGGPGVQVWGRTRQEMAGGRGLALQEFERQAGRVPQWTKEALQVVGRCQELGDEVGGGMACKKGLLSWRTAESYETARTL